MNIEEDTVNLSVYVGMDWIDVLSGRDYKRSKVDNYNSARPSEKDVTKGGIPPIKWNNDLPGYYFIPNIMPRNMISHDLTIEPPRFMKRYALGPENGDGAVIYLASGGKGTLMTKQQFSLAKFPLDVHLLQLEFESVPLNDDYLTPLIDRMEIRQARNISRSATPSIRYHFDGQDLRVKHLKAFEARECRVSHMKVRRFPAGPLFLKKTLDGYSSDGLLCAIHFFSPTPRSSPTPILSFKIKACTYPYMSADAANYRDFLFSAKLDQTIEEDRYFVKTKFYRESSGFVVQSLIPVVLGVFMTGFVDWIPPKQVGDRLGILMTLFLTLYAHKYTLVQQINTIETTAIEYVMLSGYLGIFIQCIIVVGSAPIGKNYDKKPRIGSRDALQLFMVVLLLMLVVVAVYSVLARRHDIEKEKTRKDNTTFIPEWIYKYASKESKLALMVNIASL